MTNMVEAVHDLLVFHETEDGAPVYNIPDHHQVQPSKYNLLVCPLCEHEFERDEMDTITVYDRSSAVSLIEELNTNELVVGDIDWNDFFQSKVTEEDVERCPSCAGTDDNWGSVTKWSCENCGEMYSASHQALLCCSEDCWDGTCTCLLGIAQAGNLPKYSPTDGHCLYVCQCSTECTKVVCLICHAMWNDYAATVASNHWETTHMVSSASQPDPEVGVPASLPPAFEYREAVVVTHRDCAQCDSRFCCLIHGMHKHPHVGCGQT